MALTDNLISFWELEESSGSTRNDSHGTNHLTDNNGVASGTGKVGNGAVFVRANSERLSRADNDTLSCPTTSISVCVWIKLDAKTGFGDIAAKFNTTAEWILEYRSDIDRYRFSTYSGDGFAGEVNIVANNFGAPPTGAWHFLVAWYDRDADIVGIQVNNGTADTTARTADLWDSNQEFNLGGSPNFGSFTDSTIDQVGFWKRALTSDERTFLYNSGNGRSYAEVVGGPIILAARRRRMS